MERRCSGPLSDAYYQALGRFDGVSSPWEEDGVTFGMILARRRKKAWALAFGARQEARGHTVSAEFDHRPTFPDVMSAFLIARPELLAKVSAAS